MKRTGTVLVRDDSRYAYKRSKTSIPRSITPRSTVLSRSKRVELKSIYTNHGGPFTVPAAPASLTLYGGIGAGDAYNQRNGKLIRHIDQTANFNFSLGPQYDAVSFRIIHGAWKQPNVTPAVSDVLDLSYNAFIAPLNVERARMYACFGDEYVTICNTGARAASGTSPISPGGGTMAFKRKYKYNRTQEYAGTTSADMTDWLHFVLVVSSTGVGTCEMLHTLNFTDM
jgi:hypothetical protein